MMNANVGRAGGLAGAVTQRRWSAGTLSYTVGGLASVFAFLLLGDFAWSLKERSVQDLFKAMLRELNENALLLNALVGTLPAVIVVTVGPAVGAWSDRSRNPMGRRLPLLAATAPVIGLSLVGLAYSLPLADALLKLLDAPAAWRTPTAVAMMAFFWTVFECGSVIGNALFTALIGEVVPQGLLGRFYGVFRIFSLAVGAGFFYCFFDNSLMPIVRPLLLAIGATYVVCFLMLAWGVKEGEYPQPASPAPRARRGIAGTVRQYIADCTSERLLLLLFIVNAVALVCFTPVNINAFNAKDQFGLDKTGFGQALASTYVASMLLAYPLGWLADRFHPLRVGLVTLLLYGSAMLAGGVFVHDETSFKILFIAHGVLSGAYYSGTAALLVLLLPQARFSQLVASATALAWLLTGLVSLVVGMLLDWTGRDFRLVFLIGGAIAAAAVLGWVCLLRRFERLGGLGGNPLPDA